MALPPVGPPTKPSKGSTRVQRFLLVAVAVATVTLIAAPMPYDKLAHEPVANQADDIHHGAAPAPSDTASHEITHTGTPSTAPEPPHDPLDPLHRWEIRASLLFMGFAGLRLLACLTLGVCGRKVKITMAIITLGVGAVVALLGWVVGWPLLILAGGMLSLTCHSLEHAERLMAIDEGRWPEDDPSPLARTHRFLKGTGTAIGRFFERVWARVTRWWKK